MLISGISYVWIFNVRNDLLKEIYEISIKSVDQESFGIEEIKVFTETQREKGYFIFKYKGKKIGIKFKEGKGEFLKRLEKAISVIVIVSFSILAIFIISIPFLLLPPRRGSAKAYDYDIEGDVIFTLGEMLSRLKTREEELSKEREEDKEKAEEFRVISHVILNSLPFPLLLLSSDKRILNMNRGAEKFFGRSFSSSLFLSASSILSSHFLEIVGDAEEKGSREERTVHENGKWYQIQVIPIKGEKGILASIFMLHDITDRKREEEILKERDKMASLGEMASYLAHEIKNSVGIALGYLKMSDEQMDYKEKAVKELNTISSNIERFLDFARPLELRKENLDLKKIISEIIGSLGRTDLVLEGEFPRLQGDKNLLKIVFLNLIKNSIEAGASSIKIKSHWKGEEENFVIDFIDDGTGIPEEKIEKVFLPFFSTKEGGAGLGLALSKNIILHHGGEIKIVPSEKGTTVRVILPVNV